ncbi:hypothetical protein [Desulforamulus aquiferis]|uniref:Uncharacterized protein n=1 Tax=Desulforamulus aquiferis TaxID=1397668 RepID=A0AAW7ZGD4_9FIRM|nr:hypothetical protein [Desulforamulus aquiferis]MDO7787875.1 hypothetical protein [Desulforamulus aquiferis]
MIVRHARTLLEQEMPIQIRSQLVPVIKRAYSLVEQLYQQQELLNWEVGYDLLRDLRRVAVDFELKRLIDTGKFPLAYRIAPNARKNCSHLELITNQCVITISQVVSEYAIPRFAIFRNNLSLNQLSFDFDNANSYTRDAPYYMLLTHGYKGSVPDFIGLGVPQPMIKGWLAYINLLNEPHLVDLTQEDIVTEEIQLSFKEHVTSQGVLKIGS